MSPFNEEPTMTRRRDPPARKKSRGDHSGHSLFDGTFPFDESSGDIPVKYDRYASLEASTSTVGSNMDATHLDDKLVEQVRQCILQYRHRENIERQLGSFDMSSQPTPRGMSFGEQKADVGDNLAKNMAKVMKKVHGRVETETESTVSTDHDNDDEFVDELGVRTSDGEIIPFRSDESVFKTREPETKDSEVKEDMVAQDDDSHNPGKQLPGFFFSLVDFLTCAVTDVCSASNRKLVDADGKIQYEMPLQSVQDLDDIEAWGAAEEEQDSLGSENIAEAINFSSQRVNKKNAGIALYDEHKLRQEVHKVEIPDDYFDYDDNEEDDLFCEDSAYLKPRNVPEAVVVTPKKVDDVSVLEDNSVDDSLTDPRNVQAWSLSPRRKRRLKARAKAIAEKSDP